MDGWMDVATNDQGTQAKDSPLTPDALSAVRSDRA
jgi:hypothetical protein